ncbi:O-antigen ligase family protein [Mucilaginibacter sp. cycad4]|uniref:O-antigen ligase family protein n=1 Tax=Mucilaginibacter sp. cycad4 TaxID=3342096 RepID=UPI002AAA6F9E|nr:O-antigen ligase family protein [Mucilaginibacter gossypii]WPV02347.1 O-antigen ligase family protein [Mucilaginibacter gossypii]
MTINAVISEPKDQPIKNLIFKWFLISIPFSQALTINISFPLKIAEVLLVFLISFEVTTRGILKWHLDKTVTWVLFSFVMLIIISMIVNIFYSYPYELAQNVTRLGPVFDTVFKFFYILLAICSLFITRHLFNADQRNISFFFIGAIASASYAWYLFVSGILKIPVLLLPGMDANSQVYDVGFGDIIRSGTFREGNYMGFYLLVAGILAVYYKYSKLSIFFFASIITTFSTTAIFCSVLFFVICLFHKYKKHKFKLVASLVFIFATIILLVQVSPGIKTLLYNKVFGSEDTVENSNDIFSKADRLNTVLVSMEIVADNPILGVGPANFGLHFSHYNLGVDFEQDVKKIPNNIYMEILSECGGVTFLVFVFLLWIIFNYGRKKSYILGAGLLASFIYFFAFPTFTMLFIWVFLGIVLS